MEQVTWIPTARRETTLPRLEAGRQSHVDDCEKAVEETQEIINRS